MLPGCDAGFFRCWKCSGKGTVNDPTSWDKRRLEHTRQVNCPACEARAAAARQWLKEAA